MQIRKVINLHTSPVSFKKMQRVARGGPFFLKPTFPYVSSEIYSVVFSGGTAIKTLGHDAKEKVTLFVCSFY